MGANSARDRVAAARANGDFRFTDLEWEGILKSLGSSSIDPTVRPKLERAASQFLRGHADWFKPSNDEKRVLR
ncbi:MAG TPA: hypothetical protein VN742_07780, partial [Candidatus Binataceae bacterium]|nr:hypothetical protein [Candidatus Binataceae bacterium]